MRRIIVLAALLLALAISLPVSGQASRPTGRVAGPNRIVTAVAISQYRWSPGAAHTVYIANVNGIDALAAGASVYDGPVLLTETCTVSTNTQNEIARLNPQQVIALGGQAVVCDAVLGAYASVNPR
jgi:putative cell wall-binding protein